MAPRLHVRDCTSVISGVLRGGILEKVQLLPEAQLVVVLVPTALSFGDSLRAPHSSNVFAGKVDFTAQWFDHISANGEYVGLGDFNLVPPSKVVTISFQDRSRAFLTLKGWSQAGSLFSLGLLMLQNADHANRQPIVQRRYTKRCFGFRNFLGSSGSEREARFHCKKVCIVQLTNPWFFSTYDMNRNEV